MAYQMEYAFRDIKKRKKEKGRNMVLASMLLALGIMGARLSGAVLEMLFMGGHESFYTAASEMVMHLREGMDLDEAIYVFCEEVTNEQAADLR